MEGTAQVQIQGRFRPIISRSLSSADGTEHSLIRRSSRRVNRVQVSVNALVIQMQQAHLHPVVVRQRPNPPVAKGSFL
jgi:hypothetical protein